MLNLEQSLRDKSQIGICQDSGYKALSSTLPQLSTSDGSLCSSFKKEREVKYAFKSQTWLKTGKIPTKRAAVRDKKSEVLTILSFCPFPSLAVLIYTSGFSCNKYTCLKMRGAGNLSPQFLRSHIWGYSDNFPGIIQLLKSILSSTQLHENSPYSFF